MSRLWLPQNELIVPNGAGRRRRLRPAPAMLAAQCHVAGKCCKPTCDEDAFLDWWRNLTSITASVLGYGWDQSTIFPESRVCGTAEANSVVATHGGNDVNGEPVYSWTNGGSGNFEDPRDILAFYIGPITFDSNHPDDLSVGMRFSRIEFSEDGQWSQQAKGAGPIYSDPFSFCSNDGFLGKYLDDERICGGFGDTDPVERWIEVESVT